MSQRIVIIQSNYIPWKGYFDLLGHADATVLLDSVQSTKNDWRNRNQIRTNTGKIWLTVPIKHSSALRIRDVEIANSNWADKHFRSLAQSYARAPYAAQVLPVIEGWYREAGRCTRLSDCNRVFMRGICAYLGLQTRLLEVESLISDEDHDRMSPTDRLIEICRRVDATSYLSGPAAKSYLDEDAFAKESIRVEWFDYDHYPLYPQLHGEFDHAVSILDLLLMTGPAAKDFAIRGRPQFLQEISA